jgi:PDZ domain
VPKAATLELLQAKQIRWDGVRLTPLDATLREECKLPAPVGLVVREVTEGSGAEKAGLRVGDVIAKINGEDASDHLGAIGAASQVAVALVLIRDGKEETIERLVFASPATSTRWDNALLWLEYCLAFTATRLQWCECILNIDQEWPMFSPNVGIKKYPARARLLYADGTETLVRSRSDPGDLRFYFRWGPGKNLGYDRGIDPDSGYRKYACPGWCNFLAHQHPLNENGSPLQEIRIYQVRYDFPPPGEDADAFFEDLMAKTRDHKTESDYVYTTFFRYWPEDRAAHRQADWRFVAEVYRTSVKLTELEK